MILCDANYIVDIATLITAISALITGFYLWYDRRARIIVSIEPIEKIYYLTIENVGKSVARDVKIYIDKNFIDSLPVSSTMQGKRVKEALYHLNERKFYFTSGTKKYYFLMQCEKSNPKSEFDQLCNDWYDKHKFTPFNIAITYNSWYDTHEVFFIEQFNSEASIPHDRDWWSNKHIEDIKNIIKEKL